MKSFLTIFVATLLTAGIMSCTNKQNSNTTTDTVFDSLYVNKKKDSTVSKSYVAWAGVYEGTIPAQNMIGMKMKLSLSSFDKYKLDIKTLNDNPKDNKLLTYSGDIEWENDIATFNLIGLDSISNKFKVDNNAIIYLNPDGTPNSGSLAEFYKLKKVTK